jgi:cell division protein FtsW
MKLPRRRPHLRSQFSWGEMDLSLLLVTLGLVAFGLIMVYNASVFSAFRDFGDKYYFLKYQGAWALVGLVVMLVISRIDYHFWEKLALPGLIIAIVLLLSVFSSFGIKVYGAQRWLDFGFFTLQPAEIAKLAYIIYLSAWFSKKIAALPFLALTGLILGIVLLQRDLGTATIIGFTGMTVFFIAGAVWWQFLGLGMIGAAAGGLMIMLSDYRRARLLSFLNSSADQLGTSYHINQVLIAIGSGGFFGVGLGQSRQKYGYIPEVTTDSIFAVVGNELGFLGAAGLILAFAFFLFRALKTAQRAPDQFGYLLAVGIASWLGIQIMVNIGAMVALLPLTGVPLPLISYGGTALVMVLSAIGILLNISSQRVQDKTGR